MHAGPHSGHAPLAAGAPEDALEPALRALITRTAAAGGAICLFDWGEAVLRLAVEHGLSDEGCRLLRSHRAGAAPWALPLECIRQRQACLMAGADGDAIPPLLDGDVVPATALCLPLVADDRVLGVAVLLLAAPHVFDDAQLARIAPEVEVAARVVDAIHRRVASLVRRDETSVLDTIASGMLRGVAPIVAEVERLVAWSRHLPGVRQVTARLVPAPAPPPPAGAVATLRAECRRLERQLAEADGRSAARVQSLEAALGIERDRAAAAERDREETLRAARALGDAAETRRAAAVADAEAARATRAEAEQSLLVLQADVRRLSAEVDRLRAVEQSAREARDQAVRAVAELRIRDEAARDAIADLESARQSLEDECRRLDATARDHAAEQERTWSARVARVEAELAHERTRADTLATEHARQADMLATARAAQMHTRAELDETRRAHAGARDGALEQERARGTDADAARAEAVVELDAVRQSLAEAQAIILHMEAVAALDEQGAADRELQLRQAVESSRRTDEDRAAAVTEVNGLRRRLAAAQADALAARDDARRTADTAARLEASLASAFAERDHLTGTLDEQRQREVQLSARIAELENRLRAWDEEQTQRTDQHRTTVSELEAAWRARLVDAESAAITERERVRTLAGERRDLVTDLRDAAAAEWQAREELIAAEARAEHDRDETLRRAAQLTADGERARAEAVAEAESLRAALVDAQRLLLGAEEQQRRIEAELTRLRQREDTAPAATPEPAAAAPPSSARVAGPLRIAVLDTASWPTNDDVTLLTPGDDVVERLGALDAGCVLVNLAAPGTMSAMATLRATAADVRLIGCLAGPEGDEVMLLGPVEPIARPPDPDALVPLLTMLAPRGARVLAAGTDANAFISVRQALTRAGMSVSIAWDGKQAADLLEIVRPQVLLLDLALPPRGGHGLVAQAGAVAEPPQALLLMPGPGDPAPGLRAALAATTGAHLQPRARVLEMLTRRRGSTVS